MRDEPAALTGARTAATADAAFGADMYQVLAEDAADMVFSPASVASALRMALCGARGQTAAELARVLHLDGSPRQDVAASGLQLAASRLRPAGGEASGGPEGTDRGPEGTDRGPEGTDRGSEGTDRGPEGTDRGPEGTDRGSGGTATLRAPNTVWVQSGFALRPEFTARLSHAAGALAEADFAAAPEAARAEINRVIAAQTEGKITGLLAPGAVDPLTRLVLASAVYLKAAWAQPFPQSATADAPFYPEGPDRPALTVPMMRLTGRLPYLRGDGYQAALLPYRDIGLAMAVLLPDGPMAALRPKVAAVGLGGLLAGASQGRVALSLPRFRLEAAFGLIPALRRLGVTEAFGDHADFGGITGTGRLRIGAVAHKAYIDVNEQGTEAAAATAVLAVALSAVLTPPVTLTVDRPFLFAIVDTDTALPLFLGQVSRPHPG